MNQSSGARLAPRAPDEPPQAEGPRAPADRDGGFIFTSELVTLAQDHGRSVVAVEHLVTEVITRVLDPGRRGLAICGASKGVGVTFTAANLAVALSQVGVPTMLIDANMREPGLQRLITPPEGWPGLSDWLAGAGDIDVGDLVCPEVLPNLSLIYAGAVAPDAAELLSSDAFAELMRGCQRDYALTIVDTPPANRWADVRTICKLTTYAMVVARRDSTFVDDVATLVGELQTDGVTLVGAVMNEV